MLTHGSYLMNLASPNPEFLEKSRACLVTEIERCHQLGVPYVVLHPGAHMGLGEDEGLSAIVVEQHPQAILAISDRAAVLDRGTVVHSGAADDLLDQPKLLDRLLGVARAAT